MNIDFHYGVVYIVARLGGLPCEEALTVAHACQYVDDATTPGILRFAGGETFERFATAHKLFDYSNAENDQNRLVWTPFHFLPADVKEALRDLMRTNTSIDELQRLDSVCAAVRAGAIPGLKESIPGYIAKGPGSWKCEATGLVSDDDAGERPPWSMAFERSDYRRFHDAVKEHRFVVTQEILPAYGLRIA